MVDGTPIHDRLGQLSADYLLFYGLSSCHSRSSNSLNKESKNSLTVEFAMILKYTMPWWFMAAMSEVFFPLIDGNSTFAGVFTLEACVFFEGGSWSRFRQWKLFFPLSCGASFKNFVPYFFLSVKVLSMFRLSGCISAFFKVIFNFFNALLIVLDSGTNIRIN